MTDWIRASHETEFGPKYRIYEVGFIDKLCGGVRLEPNDEVIISGKYAARFFERGMFYDWAWEYRAVDDAWVKKVGIQESVLV